MNNKTENPWDVGSVYDYLYFNCPTCCYKSNLKQYFVDHVFHTHPESIDYFRKISDDSLNDIVPSWSYDESGEENLDLKNETQDETKLKDDMSDPFEKSNSNLLSDHDTNIFNSKDIIQGSYEDIDLKKEDDDNYYEENFDDKFNDSEDLVDIAKESNKMGISVKKMTKEKQVKKDKKSQKRKQM